MKKYNFKDKEIALLGFGVEGKDALAFLLKNKARVTVFDKSAKKELDLKGVDTKKVKLSLGKNYLKGGLKDVDLIVRSPGVYRYIPEIVQAEKAGVEVTSPVKILFDLCLGKIIGVTGTKGKGTTCTLIYQILKRDKKDVHLAGNIGTPVLKLLPKIKHTSWVVLELSSFQLIDLEKSPHIAVLLNITEDHMDWHKDRKEYVEAKKNIVRHQEKTDFALLNEDYETSKSIAKETSAEVIFFSKKDVQTNLKEILLLRGEHNLENVAAALAVSKILNVSSTAIKSVISTFKGLEHRLELVSEKKGISFYNDSFATGPQPTIAAIKSFRETITLILGGYDKGLDYSELFKEIKKVKNLETIILIGDLASKFEKMLKKVKYSGKLVNLGKKPMRKIVKTSMKSTHKGGVVLLSPAAASFDMFKDYKERGQLFKKEVNKQ